MTAAPEGYYPDQDPYLATLDQQPTTAATDIEAPLLGILLTDSTQLAKVRTHLDGTYFEQPKHTWIYDAILTTVDNGIPVDMLTVYRTLLAAKAPRVNELRLYLHDLIRTAPAGPVGEHYAVAVRDAHKRRTIRAVALRIKQAADTEESIEQLIEEAFTELDQAANAFGPGATNNTRQQYPALDLEQLLSTDDDGEEWILEPIIPARRLVALYSAPKAGKSLLTLEMAVGIALGREVLGFKAERPYRVLYVDYENDPRGDIRRRLEDMGITPNDARALRENLAYLSYPQIAKLDTPEGAADLVKVVREYQAELVVIDTVSRAVGGEENDNDTWLNFYRHTGLALKQNGVACLRLDHTGKDHDKGMRGGSAKYGDVDAVWKLHAESASVLRLTCTDHRLPVSEDTLLIVRHTDPHLHHRVAGDRRVALDAKQKEYDALLDKIGVPLDASIRKAKAMVKEAGFTNITNIGANEVIKDRQERSRNTSGTGQEHLGPDGEGVPRNGGPYRALPEHLPGTTTTVPGTDNDDKAEELLFRIHCKKCNTAHHRDHNCQQETTE